MTKLSPHQQDMIATLNKMPKGVPFKVRDTVAAGYPHKDAARVLRTYAILGVHIVYADPAYDGHGINYIRKD